MQILVVLALGFPLGCSKEQAEKKRPLSVDPVLKARQEKDQAFKSSAESPLPDGDKARFTGLSYYGLNTDYRFKVMLQRHPSPQVVRFATNTKEIRQFLRYGYFEFEAQGQKYRLQVYRAMDEVDAGEPQLFVPFRDGTSGKETYGGGRYLDLKENTTGVYELDFNQAYNPYCAYGKNYSCPLPPRENTLAVTIPAGEKNYPLHE